MKKLFFLLAAWVLPLHAFYPCPEWYIGFVAGPTCLSSEVRINNHIGRERHTQAFGETNGLFGGVLGCQTVIGDTFLALQGNVMYHTLSSTIRRDTDTSGFITDQIHFTNHLQYGADFRIGLWLCSVAPYFIAGAEGGHWKLNIDNNTASFQHGIPPHTKIHLSKGLWGPKLGAGVIFPINCHWNANMEYSYTWFGKIERRFRDSDLILWKHQVSFGQNTVLFGLNYLF